VATIRTQKEIRQRAPWWLAGLLFANFALMSFDARQDSTKQRMIRVWAQTLAYPVQRVTSGAGGAGLGFFERLGNLRGAASENQQLKSRLAQMETELRDSRANAAENERLRSLLNLREKSSYVTLAASVIARDPSLWFDTVTIDRGRSAGVEINMPVVNANGIVGRVVSTSLWSAQVMLLTNEKSGAGAVVGQLGQSSAVGSIKGLGERGLLEMRYVSGLEKVALGDYVTTTGQDGVFPSGYNVGDVVEVKPGSATQAHVIHLRPSASMDKLRDVFVLLYHPPQRSASDQALPNAEKKPGSQH
jgi:rod shape-determining protein MreC